MILLQEEKKYFSKADAARGIGGLVGSLSSGATGAGLGGALAYKFTDNVPLTLLSAGALGKIASDSELARKITADQFASNAPTNKEIDLNSIKDRIGVLNMPKTKNYITDEERKFLNIPSNVGIRQNPNTGETETDPQSITPYVAKKLGYGYIGQKMSKFSPTVVGLFKPSLDSKRNFV